MRLDALSSLKELEVERLAVLDVLKAGSVCVGLCVYVYVCVCVRACV